MMKVAMTRSGGFAGISKTIELDTEQLAAEDARTLERLVQTADVFTLRSQTGGAPDRFAYVLTVEDGTRRHVVQMTEGAASPDLRALIDYLSEVAARRRRDVRRSPGDG